MLTKSRRLLFYTEQSVFVQIIRTYFSQKHHIFVYGTLKRNEPNHPFLKDYTNGHHQFKSEGYTQVNYPLIIATKANIPFLLYRPGEGLKVKGEVFEVDSIMLEHLDVLEEHKSYMERKIVDIVVATYTTLQHGQSREREILKQCWVYFLVQYSKDLLHKPMLDWWSSKGGHDQPYTKKMH